MLIVIVNGIRYGILKKNYDQDTTINDVDFIENEYDKDSNSTKPILTSKPQSKKNSQSKTKSESKTNSQSKTKLESKPQRKQKLRPNPNLNHYHPHKNPAHPYYIYNSKGYKEGLSRNTNEYGIMAKEMILLPYYVIV